MTLSLGIFASPVDRPGLDYVIEAERLGVDSVWVPEFWGYDALTPLGAVAAVTDRIRIATAIAQLGTRTPAMLAMSAMTLQRLSGGRFVLGLGTSGPQVIEGWHGVPFAKPVARTRETIEILRLITAGERLEYTRRHLPAPASRRRWQTAPVSCTTRRGSRLPGLARPRQPAAHRRRRRRLDRQLVLL